MSKQTVTVDVREDIRSGREPLGKILQAVDRLNPGEKLRLLAPFKPAPLFSLLAQRGFSHEATPLDGGDWEVLFSPGAAPAEATPGPRRSSPRPPVQSPAPAKAIVEVDARGLEPPEPLVKILEAVASLPSGSQLRALTDRRPMHLYAQLQERGLTGETEQQKDGTFVTLIRHSA